MGLWESIDKTDVKFLGVELNWMRYPREMRQAVLTLVALTGFMWFNQGFDSGVAEYGTSMHWSWFVIYGLTFYVTSWNYEKKGFMGGSRNVLASLGTIMLAFSLFELYWSIGYALSHRETWLLTSRAMMQISLIFTLSYFILALTYEVNDARWYHLLWFIPSIIWLLIGFPQTCYPQVDGTINYIENNAIHALNVISKATFTLGIIEPLKYS